MRAKVRTFKRGWNTVMPRRLRYTGLRYSDAAKLTWDDIHNNKIEIVTKKTSDRLIIDFNRMTKALLEKYSNSHYKGKKVFPVISNQKMNSICRSCVCKPE